MADFILVWKDGASTVLSHDAFFHGTEKPELSFSFDSLYCETPTEVFFRMVGDNQFLLTDEQIEECRQFCENFYENGDYNVYAYDPADDNVYKGYDKKSTCIAKGFKWVVDQVPETMAAAWDEEKNAWKIFYAAVMEDGHMRVGLDKICTKCVLLLTKEEYEAFPKPSHSTDTWDFAKGAWVDMRDLDTVKHDALLDIRTSFEAVRWKAMTEYVPDYERETWRIQLAEAKEWLSDNTASTPFIDYFLAARTDDAIPTKQALCEDIVADNDEFVKLMAEHSAIFWGYKKRIQACETGYEVDAIQAEYHEAYKR